VIVTVPSLTRLKMEGAGVTAIKKLTGDRFELAHSGVGMVILDGKVNSFRLKAEGVGMVDAKALRAQDVTASVEGIGSVDVYASERLKVNVQGIGSLTYYGKPKSISKTMDGIGSVKAGD